MLLSLAFVFSKTHHIRRSILIVFWPRASTAIAALLVRTERICILEVSMLTRSLVKPL